MFLCLSLRSSSLTYFVSFCCDKWGYGWYSIIKHCFLNYYMYIDHFVQYWKHLTHIDRTTQRQLSVCPSDTKRRGSTPRSVALSFFLAHINMSFSVSQGSLFCLSPAWTAVRTFTLFLPLCCGKLLFTTALRKYFLSLQAPLHFWCIKYWSPLLFGGVSIGLFFNAVWRLYSNFQSCLHSSHRFKVKSFTKKAREADRQVLWYLDSWKVV